jgi:CheY-like chemotaxis protein
MLRVGEVDLRFEASAPEAPGTSFTSKMLVTNTGAGALKTSQPESPKPAPVADVKPVNPSEAVGVPAKKFQVLFVDDSMAFLETFTELCAILSNQTWEIHSAASADRALAILQQTHVDLVVLDIGIPMVDGIQLLGIISRRYPGMKIAVMTGKANEGNRATCLAGGAELFIEKPVSPEGIKVVFNMLNDLVSWTHREGFTGTVRQVGLQEVIQMECIGRHSSILEIRNQQTHGQIYIEAGVVTHAAVGTLTGEKAFNNLLSMTGGEFQLKPFKVPPQRTVQSGWEVLLMEAARRSDEDTVLLPKKSVEGAARPSASNPAPAEKIPPPEVEVDHAVLGDDIVVVATYDGQWKPADDSKK